MTPHYRDGRLTFTGLLAACRLLYAEFDRYDIGTKAALAREARATLRLGEDARPTAGDGAAHRGVSTTVRRTRSHLRGLLSRAGGCTP